MFRAPFNEIETHVRGTLRSCSKRAGFFRSIRETAFQNWEHYEPPGREKRPFYADFARGTVFKGSVGIKPTLKNENDFPCVLLLDDSICGCICRYLCLLPVFG
jgi:hypothetical protein